MFFVFDLVMLCYVMLLRVATRVACVFNGIHYASFGFGLVIFFFKLFDRFWRVCCMIHIWLWRFLFYAFWERINSCLYVSDAARFDSCCFYYGEAFLVNDLSLYILYYSTNSFIMRNKGVMAISPIFATITQLPEWMIPILLHRPPSYELHVHDAKDQSSRNVMPVVELPPLQIEFVEKEQQQIKQKRLVMHCHLNLQAGNYLKKP